MRREIVRWRRMSSQKRMSQRKNSQRRKSPSLKKNRKRRRSHSQNHKKLIQRKLRNQWRIQVRRQRKKNLKLIRKKNLKRKRSLVKFLKMKMSNLLKLLKSSHKASLLRNLPNKMNHHVLKRIVLQVKHLKWNLHNLTRKVIHLKTNQPMILLHLNLQLVTPQLNELLQKTTNQPTTIRVLVTKTIQ